MLASTILPFLACQQTTFAPQNFGDWITLGTCVATIVYVGLTYFLLRQTKQNYIIVNSPFVTTEQLELKTNHEGHKMFGFSCKNHGNLAASEFAVKIEFDIDKKFTNSVKRPPAEGNVLIAPHAIMHFNDDIQEDDFFTNHKDRSTYIRLEVSYKGLDNQTKTRQDIYKKDYGENTPFQYIDATGE